MVRFSSKSVQLHSKASQGEESHLTSNGAGRHSFARAPIELHIAFTLNKSLPFNGKFGALVEKRGVSQHRELLEETVGTDSRGAGCHLLGYISNALQWPFSHVFYSANSDDFCS